VDYRIIDAHLHPSSSYKPACIDNIDQVFEIMDDNGLDRICMQSVTMWYDWTFQLNPLLLLMKLLRPGRIYAFGGIRFPDPSESGKPFDYDKQARDLIAVGFDGIKLFAKPTVRRTFGESIDNPVFDKLYTWLNDTGTPIMYHIADPETFWDENLIPENFRARGWYYGGGSYPSQRQLFDETEAMLDRYPNLHVILPHFYFHSASLSRLAALLDQHPQLRIDCTPGIEMYYNFSQNIEAARMFFIRYSNRIHFGTDNFGCALGDELDYLSVAKETIRYVRDMLENRNATIYGEPQNGLALPEDVLRKIYAENFLDYLDGDPKLVSVKTAIELTRSCIERASMTEPAHDQLQFVLAKMEALI
jgi:predicted TIM-barrel fold metal-dependent hydrolase